MARASNGRLVGTSVVAGVLAAGLGTTLALWQAQDSTALALHGARHAFQARQLDDDPGSIQVTDPDVFALTVESEIVVEQLENAGTAYVPFRVYGAVEGGGAMTYQLTGVDGGVLAGEARVALWRVDDAATQCAAGTLDGDRVYPAQGAYGPFSDLSRERFGVTDDLFDQLVAPGSADGTLSGRHDYCLEVRLLGAYYENTATAGGVTSDGVAVGSSDSWDGTFVPDVPAGDQTTIHFQRSVGRGAPAAPPVAP